MATCPLSFRRAGRSELFAGSLHTASPTSLQELRLQARSFSRSQRGQGWNRPALASKHVFSQTYRWHLKEDGQG